MVAMSFNFLFHKNYYFDIIIPRAIQFSYDKNIFVFGPPVLSSNKIFYDIIENKNQQAKPKFINDVFLIIRIIIHNIEKSSNTILDKTKIIKTVKDIIEILKTREVLKERMLEEFDKQKKNTPKNDQP